MRIFILALAVIATAGQAQEGEQDEAVALNPDTILVSRGPAKITLQDFQAALQAIPAKHREAAANSPERIGTLLDSLVKARLMAMKAEERDLDEDPLVQKQFQVQKEKILANALLEQVESQPLDVDLEQLAREHYLTNKDQYRSGEKVSVSHILIGTDERSKQEAKELADKVRELAVEGEKSFEELVAEYSDDPSATSNQGRFESVRRGQMVKPFEEKAFSMTEPGAISEPVETRFGFHIIRFEGSTPSRQKSFDEVRSQVMSKIREQQRKRARGEFIGQLMEANPMEADPEVIRALRENYRLEVPGEEE